MSDARASELLRQEREAFDQAKAHAERWFTLRLAIGYAGILLLIAIGSMSSYVLLHPASFLRETVRVAAAALLVDMLGLSASIFKLVLQQVGAGSIKPVKDIRQDTH